MVNVARKAQRVFKRVFGGRPSLLLTGTTLLVVAFLLPLLDPSGPRPLLSASGVAFTFGAATLGFLLLNRGSADRNGQLSHPLTSVQLSQLMEGAEFPCLCCDADGRILAANESLKSLVSVKDVADLNFEELGFQVDENGDAERLETSLNTSSGEKTFAWQKMNIPDVTSGSGGYMLQGRDITAERAAIKEERAARQRAERSDGAKSRLLGTVSHDIRTPLSGISGMCHLLTQTRLTPEQRNYLAGIRQSSNALAHLVDDLLDLVSLDAGRFQLRPQDESLRSLLESVTEMLAHRAHEKGIEIASWVSSDIPAVMSFDPARLRQVLFNVIGNAVKFTHKGGVLVEARLERGMVLIKVQDSGTGMSPEDQARIFGEFEQVGSSAERSGGTGLGLAISARIIAEAGGDISVASELGHGSTFTIRLPVEFSGDFAAKGGRKSVLSGSRVLVISPEGPTSRALTRTIETLGGEYHFADDIAKAEEILTETVKHGAFVSDVIADHRLATGFTDLIAQKPGLCHNNVRKIFLVNPESRTSRVTGIGFDSWLVRPLRERSLIDVLLGRMKGIELRDPLNDNHSGSQPASRFTVPDGEGMEVLVAEDDPVNALLIRATLTKAGHRVRTVEDFSSLVAAATGSRPRPDILVTDLSMPGGSGIDAIGVIRTYEADENLAELPVIIVSGRTGDDVRELVMEAGASEYLAKPADPSRLVELVEMFGSRQRRHG